MMHPDILQTLHRSVQEQLLREAEHDRLAAQLPARGDGLRVTLAAWLHALADWVQPSSLPVEPLRVRG
jgi:hypothetical protein